jgi:hypothetical protein
VAPGLVLFCKHHGEVEADNGLAIAAATHQLETLVIKDLEMETEVELVLSPHSWSPPE